MTAILCSHWISSTRLRFNDFSVIVINTNITWVQASSHSCKFSWIISKPHCGKFGSTQHVFEIGRLFVSNHWFYCEDFFDVFIFSHDFVVFDNYLSDAGERTSFKINTNYHKIALCGPSSPHKKYKKLRRLSPHFLNCYIHLEKWKNSDRRSLCYSPYQQSSEYLFKNINFILLKMYLIIHLYFVGQYWETYN